MPVVEGKSVLHAFAAPSRWTACLSCCSDCNRIRDRWPFAEAMYKAEDNGPKRAQLEQQHRNSGLEGWLSVTTAHKGSYRSADVVNMLRNHLENNHPDRKFEIVIADDFSAHKTDPVRDLVWAKGAFLLTLGGGVTGAQQPCDVGLNQRVRKQYGAA